MGFVGPELTTGYSSLRLRPSPPSPGMADEILVTDVPGHKTEAKPKLRNMMAAKLFTLLKGQGGMPPPAAKAKALAVELDILNSSSSKAEYKVCGPPRNTDCPRTRWPPTTSDCDATRIHEHQMAAITS